MAGMKELDRPNVAGIRHSLSKLGAVVAEIDRELRYVWIDNPHPDFDAQAVVGKRDDDLIPKAEAEPIMSLKRDAFVLEAPVARILSFNRSDGCRHYSLFAYPIRDAGSKVNAILTVGFDVPSTAQEGFLEAS
jgi:hypothetical protein